MLTYADVCCRLLMQVLRMSASPALRRLFLAKKVEAKPLSY